MKLCVSEVVLVGAGAGLLVSKVRIKYHKNNDEGLICQFCMESLVTQAHCISCPAWNRIRQGLNMNKIEDLLTFFELEKMSPRLDYWTTRGNFIFLIVVSLFYSFMCEILSQIQNTESIELSSRVGPYS